MGAHAILGASSSKRWMSCPGSVRLSSNVPQGPSSKFAEQGTAAHTLGEWCLDKKVDPREFKGEVITTDEGSSFVVDNDMIDAVRVYYDLIKEDLAAVGFTLDDVQIEQRFNLEWLHKGMFGTNDASFSVPFGDLYIYDYKHGAGVAVDSVDNTQLLYYAIGAAYDVERECWHDYENIHMIIVQPRAYHADGEVRRWTIAMDELIEWSKKLKVAAIATEAKDAPLVPSEEACRWCPAASYCKAVEAKAMEVFQKDFDTPHTGPLDKVELMTLEECVKVVNHKNLLKKFVEACEWRLDDSILREGKAVKGMKVVRGKGSRDWVDTAEAQRSLAQSFPMGDIMEMKLKSPAKLEKIVGKKLIKDMVYKREGALKVAPVGDKRKEVTFKNAEELFDKI